MADRKRRTAFWTVALLGTMFAGEASAQTGATTASLPHLDSALVRAGSWVKVVLNDDSEVRGTVLSLGLTTLTVRPRMEVRDSVQLELAEVSEVWVERGTRALPGLLLGAALGLAIGKAYVLSACQGVPGDRCTTDISAKAYIGLGTGVGGLMGLVVGSGMPRWRIVAF